jgi:hypothetical protein
MPTRVKPFQMLDPIEPSYRRPGLREIAELQGALSGLPAGGEIDRSIAERRDRLLEVLEQSKLGDSTRTVLEKLWADALKATSPESNYPARSAVTLLTIAIRACIERERDKHYAALTDAQRSDATVRSTFQIRSDEIASESRQALTRTESRPSWILDYESFIHHVADRFAAHKSS